MRFVCVDDSRPMREVIEGILKRAGHEVVGIGKNGLEAIDLCRKLKPDAVTLDINMPIMGGDTAARTLFEDGCPKYIFMLSSMGQESVYKPLIDMGAAFISKPYSEQKVLAIIDRTIHG